MLFVCDYAFNDTYSGLFPSPEKVNALTAGVHDAHVLWCKDAKDAVDAFCTYLSKGKVVSVDVVEYRRNLTTQDLNEIPGFRCEPLVLNPMHIIDFSNLK